MSASLSVSASHCLFHLEPWNLFCRFVSHSVFRMFPSLFPTVCRAVSPISNLGTLSQLVCRCVSFFLSPTDFRFVPTLSHPEHPTLPLHFVFHLSPTLSPSLFPAVSPIFSPLSPDVSPTVSPALSVPPHVRPFAPTSSAAFSSTCFPFACHFVSALSVNMWPQHVWMSFESLLTLNWEFAVLLGCKAGVIA